MNRNTDNIRATLWQRKQRVQLAKLRVIWCLTLAPLLGGIIYLAEAFGTQLARWLDGNESAGWSAILWGAAFLTCTGATYLVAIEWPDADEQHTLP